MNVVLITGGTRSGKSRYAQALARDLGGDEVTFVATAIATDAEMVRRIERHRRERPQPWKTLEAPQHAGRAVRDADTSVVLLDCVTMLAANATGRAKPESEETMLAAIGAELDEVLEGLREREGTLIAVTNEVGWGVHPATALGRWFEIALGIANQRLAAAAEDVVLMVAGLPLLLKQGGQVTSPGPWT